MLNTDPHHPQTGVRGPAFRESDFINVLRDLLSRRVRGLDGARKREIIQQLIADPGLDADAATVPECRWVPFMTGRRPTDEASYPGLGSSDHVAMILDGSAAEGNTAYLLFRAENLSRCSESELRRLEFRVSLSFTGPRGDEVTTPLPNWSGRIIEPQVFTRDDAGQVRLAPAALSSTEERCFVLPLPASEFLPGHGWEWPDLDPVLREPATDAADPFTFGHLFLQQVHAEIMLLRDGVPVSASQTSLDVCDARRFGSLYRRVVERVIEPDTARQAQAHGLTLDRAYHPWYPVLHIGSDKAALYTRALVEDIVHKRHHLTDPQWLLRVGLYLEFLTCIGIFEAVREDVGDLLTPAERHAYETHAWFAPIRDAVNVKAWKHVWGMRHIVMPQTGAPRAGQVSALNLLAKKKATLAFLEAHHDDLKHAIALAGPNAHNAQETWHRVFRDAERAVLRKTPSAFPELAGLAPKAQDFVLWHQCGRLGALRLPQAVSGWFGDQDGLYASACNQYRASMNHVADWARERGLMDHAGSECVPEAVSLLRAFMQGQQIRLAQLQRRDGYAGTIEVTASLPDEIRIDRERVVALLRGVGLFQVLTDQELSDLAANVRPIDLGPVERIIVQGRPGSSLFVVAEGTLEVLVRQEDGTDLPVATLEPGAVFGEMSILTGEPRSATVRSIDAAVVYEIGRRDLAAVLEARKSVVDELAALMAPRLHANANAAKAYEEKSEVGSLGTRIRSFLFGN
jgi:hypothetical protein